MARRQRRKPKTGSKLSRRRYQILLLSLIVILLTYFLWPRPRLTSQREYGVTIVDAFYSSSPQFTDKLREFLTSNGIRTEFYRDSNITVEFYKNLPKHSKTILLLRVHAGIFAKDPTSPTYLFTREPYTSSSYFFEQLTGQVLSGVTNPDDKTETPVFTVGPAFIAASMEGTLNDTFIILSSCLGLYNSQLGEEFIKKGAKAFISWDEKVSLYHTDEAISLLIRTLLQDGGTMSEAVGKVMKEVGEDETYHSQLKYYPKEAGSLRAKL